MKEEKEKRELSLSSSFYSHTMMRLDRHSIKIYIRIGKGLSKKKKKRKERKENFYIAQWAHLVQFTFGINNESEEWSEGKNAFKDFLLGDLYTYMCPHKNDLSFSAKSSLKKKKGFHTWIFSPFVPFMGERKFIFISILCPHLDINGNLWKSVAYIHVMLY